jgi:hypothetical protein
MTTTATVRTPQPSYLPLIVENLPIDDLAPYRNFVHWSPEWREGKNGKPGGWTKVLKNPRTGRNAKSNDPATWASAYDVIGRFDRFGFVVFGGDPFTFIDIDNAIDATGRIKPWAQPIVDRFPSAYWERSTTGTGLKGLVRGQVLRNRIVKVGDGQVEIFSTGKFTALTGHRLEGSSATIGDGQAALDALYAELCPEPSAPARELPELNLDDEAIIANGRKMAGFGPLYDRGDVSGYGNDHSSADLALLNFLIVAGATGADQLDRLYRSSALARDKWDEKRGAKTYGERTLEKALDGSVVPYDWNQPARPIAQSRATRQTPAPLAADSPTVGFAPGACADRVAELERQLTEARATIAERDATIVALTQTILNPHLTHTEKVAAVSIARHADAKRAGGQVEPDGRVVLSASEVADDWRPKPEPGEHIAPVNPDSGTAPHMPRSSARSILDTALERELVQGEKRGTLRHRKDGSTFRDWEYVVSPATSFADLLNPWASWRPDQPKVRKVRESRACPHCGEAHPITRVDYCGGCGGELSRQTIEQPDAGENISPIRSVAQERYGRKTFSHSTPLAEPAWLTDAPDPWDTPPQPTLFVVPEPSPRVSHHFDTGD